MHFTFLKYIDEILNADRADLQRLMVDEPHNFFPLKNNILFDSAKHVLAEYERRARCVMSGLMTSKDAPKTLYSEAQQHIENKILINQNSDD